MPKVNLPSGKVVLIEVRHYYKRVRRREKFQMRRATRISLVDQNLDGFAGWSECSPLDTFNKRTGKNVAIKRLFAKERFKDKFSPEDMAAIYTSICPSCKKKAAKERKSQPAAAAVAAPAEEAMLGVS